MPVQPLVNRHLPNRESRNGFAGLASCDLRSSSSFVVADAATSDETLFVNAAGNAKLPAMDKRSFSDVGGTPGGLGYFLLGFAMACVGGFFITHQVSIVGSYWNFWGGNSFGITLLPMLFGVGILFWNAKSLPGWVLTAGGALFILAGIVANLHIYFRPTSLFNTMVMLILLVGGLVLIARSLRSQGAN